MKNWQRRMLIVLGITIFAFGILLYLGIAKSFSLSEKLNEIENIKYIFKIRNDDRKVIFLANQAALDRISEKLIKKYSKESVYIEYGGEDKITCNGKSVNDDKELVEVYQGIHKIYKTEFFDYGQKFSIYYNYTIPEKIEQVPLIKQDISTQEDVVKVPEIFKTAEGRYRIDFYLIETPYVRMSLKYLSVDDLNEQSIRARKIFGERLAPHWFYYTDY